MGFVEKILSVKEVKDMGGDIYADEIIATDNKCFELIEELKYNVSTYVEETFPQIEFDIIRILQPFNLSDEINNETRKILMNLLKPEDYTHRTKIATAIRHADNKLRIGFTANDIAILEKKLLNLIKPEKNKTIEKIKQNQRQYNKHISVKKRDLRKLKDLFSEYINLLDSQIKIGNVGRLLEKNRKKLISVFNEFEKLEEHEEQLCKKLFIGFFDEDKLYALEKFKKREHNPEYINEFKKDLHSIFNNFRKALKELSQSKSRKEHNHYLISIEASKSILVNMICVLEIYFPKTAITFIKTITNNDSPVDMNFDLERSQLKEIIERALLS